MAEIAMKRPLQKPGSAVREQLRALDDAGVVTAFLGGEERAFEELVDRYQGRLLNFVYRTIGDREKGEDLVQEVFIRVYRHLHRFDRSKKFSTWIYTIASNLAKNELRNRSRNPLVLFQTIRKSWQDDDRPLQFEDTTARPDDLYRNIPFAFFMGSARPLRDTYARNFTWANGYALSSPERPPYLQPADGLPRVSPKSRCLRG